MRKFHFSMQCKAKTLILCTLDTPARIVINLLSLIRMSGGVGSGGGG